MIDRPVPPVPRPAGLPGFLLLLLVPVASAGDLPVERTEPPMEQLLDIDLVYGAPDTSSG